MEIKENDIKILGKMVSISADGKIASAEQVYDDTFEKGAFQSDINKNLQEQIKNIQNSNNDFENNLYIKGYVDSFENLPKNALIGDIYGVGPIYEDDDSEKTKPYYKIYINTVSGWNKEVTITKIYKDESELPTLSTLNTIVLVKKSTDTYIVCKYSSEGWIIIANLGEIYSSSEDILNVGDNIYALVQSDTEGQYDLYKRVVSWVEFGTYNSISAGIVQELGDQENVVMSQKGVKNAIVNKINLSAIDLDTATINKIVVAQVPCRYIVTTKFMTSDFNVGVLECFGDSMGHMVTQKFTTHYTLPFSQNTHTDEKLFTYQRSYHIQGGTSTIPVGTWSEWTQIYSSDNQKDIDTFKISLQEINTSVSELDKVVFPLAVTLSVSPTIVEAGASTEVTISWSAMLKGQSINDVADFTLNDTSVKGTTSKKETITDATPTTKTYALVTSYDNRSNTSKVNLSVVGAMYFGFNAADAVGTLDITSLGKQSLKTSPNGTHTLQNSIDGHYMWLCVPNNMNINRVTLNGFDVPVETADTKEVGSIIYKCYRSSNALTNGSYTIIIA